MKYCKKCGEKLIRVEMDYYDTETGKKVFSKFCPNWLDDFEEEVVEYNNGNWFDKLTIPNPLKEGKIYSTHSEDTSVIVYPSQYNNLYRKLKYDRTRNKTRTT